MLLDSVLPEERMESIQEIEILHSGSPLSSLDSDATSEILDPFDAQLELPPLDRTSYAALFISCSAGLL
jgi:hypothetical protein